MTVSKKKKKKIKKKLVHVCRCSCQQKSRRQSVLEGERRRQSQSSTATHLSSRAICESWVMFPSASQQPSNQATTVSSLSHKCALSGPCTSKNHRRMINTVCCRVMLSSILWTSRCTACTAERERESVCVCVCACVHFCFDNGTPPPPHHTHTTYRGDAADARKRICARVPTQPQIGCSACASCDPGCHGGQQTARQPDGTRLPAADSVPPAGSLLPLAPPHSASCRSRVRAVAYTQHLHARERESVCVCEL